MNVRKISQKQEKSVAKDLNARTVVASGALWNAINFWLSVDNIFNIGTTLAYKIGRKEHWVFNG